MLLAACTGPPVDSAVAVAGDTAWSPPDCATRVTVSEGVWGAVLRRRGFGTAEAEDPAPLDVSVRAWSALRDADLARADDRPGVPGVYREPGAPPLAEARTDADGSHELALPAGEHSVLVQDLGDGFCDGPAAEGVCRVAVRAGATTRNDVMVDRCGPTIGGRRGARPRPAGASRAPRPAPPARRGR